MVITRPRYPENLWPKPAPISTGHRHHMSQGLLSGVLAIASAEVYYLEKQVLVQIVYRCIF